MQSILSFYLFQASGGGFGSNGFFKLRNLQFRASFNPGVLKTCSFLPDLQSSSQLLPLSSAEQPTDSSVSLLNYFPQSYLLQTPGLPSSLPESVIFMNHFFFFLTTKQGSPSLLYAAKCSMHLNAKCLLGCVLLGISCFEWDDGRTQINIQIYINFPSTEL